MAHWCRICFRHKPNEKFSGKGHRDHICKECSRRTKAERDAIDHEREILGYYEQRNISKINQKKLGELSQSPNPRIAALAETVLAVGKAKPHRRKRLGFLARNHPDVMKMLEAVGLIIPQEEYRAMWMIDYSDDDHEYNFMLFQREMDDLLLSGEHLIDPGEIGRLLLEHSKVVNRC